MISFAAEGGYQIFELGGTEWFWLIFSALSALLALGVGFALMRGVLAADQGTPTMIEIAAAIQEGAMAYLKRQFRTIGVILIPVAIIVFVTSTEIAKPPAEEFLGLGGASGMSYFQSGAVPHGRVRRRRSDVRAHRVHRHEPGRARQRPHGGGGARRLAARRARASRSAPAGSPACSRSASACSAPP